MRCGLALSFFFFALISASGLIGGCILDFDGLTGGDGGSDGGADGGGASCPDCSLCEGFCDANGESCGAILDTAESFSAFRAAVSKGVLFVSDPDPTVGAVLRFTKADGHTVFETPVAPHALTVNDAYIFWSTAGDGLFRCEQEGCAKLVNLTPGNADTVARQMAADASTLYWITGPDIASGKVMRCAINACVPEPIAMDQYRPHGMALDEQFVYWSVHGSEGSADGSIMRARKDGTDVITFVPALRGPSGVAVTATHLYFTLGVLEGQVFRCALGASTCGPLEEITPPSSVAGSPFATPMSVAAMGEWVYWTNDGDTTIMACPTAGCATTMDGLPVIVAKGLAAPGGLFATGGCLFWTGKGGVFGIKRSL
jgi:hypothetical protein